jgi:hypothetical protein
VDKRGKKRNKSSNGNAAPCPALSREKHISGASDISTRITDAISTILATCGISYRRQAIINAIHAVSGGRLDWFLCSFDSLAKRLRKQVHFSGITLPNQAAFIKTVQREMCRLLDEQKKAGLETSSHVIKRRKRVEGYILSYHSAPKEGVVGEFRLDIKRHALRAYEKARGTPNYRRNKAAAVEKAAHEIGLQLLQSGKFTTKNAPKSVHLVSDKTQGGAGEQELSPVAIRQEQKKALLFHFPDSIKQDERDASRGLMKQPLIIGGKAMSYACPEILSHVAIQMEGLCAAGVDRFTLRIVHIWGKERDEQRVVNVWNDLSPEEALQIAPLAVQRCRDMVEQKNSAWNAIITPYAMEGIQILQADDINCVMLDRFNGHAFQQYRTSDGDGNGNYQALVAVRSDDPTLFYRFKQSIRSDMGASRSIRVAGGYNAKPWRLRSNGVFPIFTLIDDEPGLIIEPETLVEAGLLIRARQLKVSAAANNQADSANILPSYEYFVERGELRADGSGTDISRVDFNYVKCMVDRGFSFNTIIQELSRHSLIKRANKLAYFERTVTAAFNMAGTLNKSQTDDRLSVEIETDNSIHRQRLEYRSEINYNQRDNRQAYTSRLDRDSQRCPKCTAILPLFEEVCACGTELNNQSNEARKAVGE